MYYIEFKCYFYGGKSVTVKKQNFDGILLICKQVLTLDSRIEVGPAFIIFGFFSSPHCLIKDGESTTIF